ncbi:MAG: FKBP-type peptidyl-prolyl cis-trans isomerase [Bacteroidetes bacterium]|nr:FKBP-type peptidyl-prolyl cis-trans isomerase [Bacteroidota bacterium]
MKKIFFLGIGLVAMSFFVNAQKTTRAKPAVKSTVKKTVAKPVPVFKNATDSASYAIGLSVVNFYKQQGLTKLNANLVAKAINDVIGGKKVLLNDNEANTCIMGLMNKIQSQKSQPAIDEGNKFLAENKKRPGVKTTASGIQYEVEREGTGIKPKAIDSVTVNYMGTLLNGTEFDNSYKSGQPVTFPLNRVIPGWTEALQLMTVGSKYKFYIPYNLAYGVNENGPIPGGSTLVFEIELLDVKPAQQTKQVNQ